MQGWDGPESRTATSTATAFVSGVPAVFARARMTALNWADGTQPNTYEGRNRHWGSSGRRVQILSARPENQQFRGGFGEIRNRLFCAPEGAVRRPVRRPNSRLPSRRFTSERFGYPITVEG